MSEKQPSNLSERDSHFMDALLSQTLRPTDGDSGARVERLLTQIRTTIDNPAEPIDRPRKRRTWLHGCLAAVALAGLLLVIQSGGPQNAAMAAVERSILAEQRPETREYLVTIVTRTPLGRRRTVTHTLFVRQREFAIRATPRLGKSIGKGEIWIGRHGKERWIVPRFGPVQVGNESLFKRTATNQQLISTPFLSVSTILERIKRSYDLQLTTGVSLPEGQTSVLCEHIIGTKTHETQFVIPENVELWADTQTGFARRIELRWNDDRARWLKATAQLIDTHDLPANFFEHSSHHDADRKVNRIEE